MVKAIRINTDKTFEVIQIGADLDSLYKAIGNGCDMVQTVNIGNGQMWMDEEATIRSNPPPVNVRATEFSYFMNVGFQPGTVLLGNVLLLGSRNSSIVNVPLKLETDVKRFFETRL